MRVSNRRPIVGLVAVLIVVAGCGGGGGGEPTAGSSAPPAQSSVTVTSADNEPFALEAGRYRFGWQATGCTNVAFTMTGASSGFTYEKTSNIVRSVAIVSNVPADIFTIEGEAGCTEWQINLDRIGG